MEIENIETGKWKEKKCGISLDPRAESFKTSSLAKNRQNLKKKKLILKLMIHDKNGSATY